MAIIGWSCKPQPGVAFGLAAIALGFMLAITTPGMVQAQPAGLDPSRDCQTVRTCNFSRTGAVRGCLSSYTCRVCKTVRSRCHLAGQRYCQRFVCTWGG